MRHIEMKYVKDKKRRKEMYRKRSTSLKKSAFELSKLCDIPVLMICFGEEGDVITWPENKQEIEEIDERNRKCTYKIRHSNRNSFCNTEKMRKQVEKTKAKLREMTAESASEIKQSMCSKLKEIRGRIEALSQQNNKDSDDNIAQEECMPVETETLATSANSEGSQNVQSFDLNQLALDENQGGMEEDNNLVVKEESEPAIENSEDARRNPENEDENFNGGQVKTDSNEEHVRRNQGNEQDEHENARMAMRCHWYWMAMNYWSAQLNRSSSADDRSSPSGVVQNPLDFMPGPANFITPLLPTVVVQPADQNGVPLGSGNVVANESDGVQHQERPTSV